MNARTGIWAQICLTPKPPLFCCVVSCCSLSLWYCLWYRHARKMPGCREHVLFTAMMYIYNTCDRCVIWFIANEKDHLYCNKTVSIDIYLFAFSYCSWGYRGKNTGVVCYCLLQWTTFCQKAKRRRGWQRMTWLGSITDSQDMNLSKLQGDTEVPGSLACSSPWGPKESDTN